MKDTREEIEKILIRYDVWLRVRDSKEFVQYYATNGLADELQALMLKSNKECLEKFVSRLPFSEGLVSSHDGTNRYRGISEVRLLQELEKYLSAELNGSGKKEEK